MADLSKPVLISAIDVALIDVAAGRRKLDPAWVETLADLFASQGQQSPVELLTVGDRFRLIFGGHRLAAAKLLGWPKVDAIVKDATAFANEADIKLREITENMARRELSALDRAVDIARWREIYEATHIVAKPGRKAKSMLAEELTAKFAVNFSAAAQKAFGLSERSIYHAIKIATIDAEVRDTIALHPIADNQSELLLLAAEKPERQEAIARLLTLEADDAPRTVADALAIIDRTPAPVKQAGWQKLSENFSRMKASDQQRFFALHEAAILAWLKERAA